MRSEHPFAFWILFSVVSAVFLVGWFVYWEVRKQGLTSVSGVVEKFPIAEEWKSGMSVGSALGEAVLDTGGQERAFLVLFENDMELRPGGGFIGAFGVLGVKDGEVTRFDVHDTGNFDGRIPDTVEPPYPMRETLGIRSWKLRDSNWDPDFPENARRAIEMYRMGGGQEEFAGVVGITTTVLSSILRVTGPIEVPGYPRTYDAETGVYDLEFQVEKGYEEQGIPFADRKSVIGVLGSAIINRVKSLPTGDYLTLIQTMLGALVRKDIQIYLTDEALMAKVRDSGWSGEFDDQWPDDFVMAVDANLNAWKTDRVMRRSYRYEVDLRTPRPKATLTIVYEHTATAGDFMTKDYQSFLRVYVPGGSWIGSIEGNSHPPVFGEYLGRKYVGALVQVPLGATREVVVRYELPAGIERSLYDLKFARQPGMSDAPVEISITYPDGTVRDVSTDLGRDIVLGKTK